MRHARVRRSSSAVLTGGRFAAPASTSPRMGAAPTVSASHKNASSRPSLRKPKRSYRRTPSGVVRIHHKARSCTVRTVNRSRSTAVAIRTRRHLSNPGSIRRRRRVTNSHRCTDSSHRHRVRLHRLVKSEVRMNHTHPRYHHQTPVLRPRCLSSHMLIPILPLVRHPLLLLPRSILLPNRTTPTPTLISSLARHRRARTRMRRHVHPLLPTRSRSRAVLLCRRRPTACTMIMRCHRAQRKLRLNGKASRSTSWSDRRHSRLLRLS